MTKGLTSVIAIPPSTPPIRLMLSQDPQTDAPPPRKRIPVLATSVLSGQRQMVIVSLITSIYAHSSKRLSKTACSQIRILSPLPAHYMGMDVLIFHQRLQTYSHER